MYFLSVEFTFTSEGMDRRADEVVDYLRGPRLWIPKMDYPDFDAWCVKVHSQLKSEGKRALVALHSSNIVGAIVYQRHQTEGDTLEVKNLTVRPDMQGRHIASFLLRNAEVEGAHEFGVRQALIDAKVSNWGIRAYLLGQGYQILGATDLYGLGSGDDIIYHKPLRVPRIPHHFLSGIGRQHR